jgi:hypothetical protein
LDQSGDRLNVKAHFSSLLDLFAGAVDSVLGGDLKKTIKNTSVERMFKNFEKGRKMSSSMNMTKITGSGANLTNV